MRKLTFLFLLSSAAAILAEGAPCVWDMPRLWPRHSELRRQMIEAMQRGDVSGMEAACRAGIELLPDDPTWHYNLACALAYRDNSKAALDVLEKAIDLGFRDANAIAKDNDLLRLRVEKRFEELVAKARRLADVPIPGRPLTAPAPLRYGGRATVGETNVVWDFDTGVPHALVRFAGENAPSPLAPQYRGPAAAYVTAWISEGTGAGNGGDVYMNRDRDHAPLDCAKFPLLSRIDYAADGRARSADVDLPNLRFGDGVALFGNASRARTEGPFWRSLPRSAMTDPGAARRMALLYLDNQFWVFPAHMDYGKPDIGDVFPAQTPFLLTSVGSSWSDRPFLEAALAASAAFPRPTKQALLKRRLMAPTLQWLIRRTLRGVQTETDYLSPRAHPMCFDVKRLDVEALAQRAHALRPSAIPPVAALTLVNSRLFPVKYPEPGRDYPEPVGEFLYVTPVSIAVVLRAPDAQRTFLVKATPLPESDPSVTFAWRVVSPNAPDVKITAPTGETLETPERGTAQIVFDRTHLTNRLDIAVFAKAHGTDYGAPSFISFYPIPQERRTYDKNGRLLEIDNAHNEEAYTDPMIALPRHWKDVYRYAPDGTCLGFTRSFNGEVTDEFTADCRRIAEKNPDGTPRRTVKVKYVPRPTGVADLPPDLTYVDAE